MSQPESDSAQEGAAPPLRRLGDFRIVREIGRGGMALVYEATQLSLGRTVALKILPRSLGLDPKRVRRFEREALAAARLHHKNIVPIHAVGEDGGIHYLAMELVRGPSLARVLHEVRHGPKGHGPKGHGPKGRGPKGRGPKERDPEAYLERALAGSQTPETDTSTRHRSGGSSIFRRAPRPSRPGVPPTPGGRRFVTLACRLGAQIAGALACAHEQGVIHRDVKPANILIDSDGVPKLTDFGLAFEQGKPGLTVTGEFMGSPYYASPEQVTGKRIGLDARTDIWSLGVTLFEMLTLRRPFEGSNVMEVQRKVVTGDPPRLRKLNPRIHRDLETIAHKCLEKDAARRYADCRELKADLVRFLNHEPILARPPGLLRRCRRALRRNAAAVLGITAAVTILLAGIGIPELRSGLESRHRRASVLGHLSAARRMLESDPKSARKSANQALQLAPGNQGALELVTLADEAIQREKRKADAKKLVDTGLKRFVRIEGLPGELSTLSERAKEVEEGATRDAWREDPGILGKLARARLEVAAKRSELDRSFGEAVAAFNAALGLDPDNMEAHRGLAKLYWWKRKQALERWNLSDVEYFEGLVRRNDKLAEYSNKLKATGTVAILTEPAGAEVYLFRHENEDLRLVPVPCRVIDASSGKVETRPPPAPTRKEAYPLLFEEFNRLGTTPLGASRIAKGSYLLVLRRAGYEPCRYPVLVQPETPALVDATLVPQGNVDGSMVYVPGGPCILGGDPSAGDQAWPRKDANVSSFWISRHEITWAEYAEFLNDREKSDPGSTERDALRPDPKAIGGGLEWKRAADDGLYHRHEGRENYPIVGVTWEAASEYCRWRSEKEGAVYRLPTEVEWEKAARGADGRFFPWGFEFSWLLCLGDKSYEEPALRPVLAVPEDESPYGVRDLAGSVSEWCDWCADDPNSSGSGGPGSRGHPNRGGCWEAGDSVAMRCAGRAILTGASYLVGFRVVREADTP